MSTFTDPMFALRRIVERHGFRVTRQGRRGFALLHSEHVILRRRQASHFSQACKAAVAYFDALTN